MQMYMYMYVYMCACVHVCMCVYTPFGSLINEGDDGGKRLALHKDDKCAT